MANVFNCLDITGAYGRDYTHLDDAIISWQAGRDFHVIEGAYCSIRDSHLIITHGYSHVRFIARDGRVLGRHILTPDVKPPEQR